MLRLLRLVEQFNDLERGIADEWTELRLQLTLDDESRSERAAALLAPANAGVYGSTLRFAVDRPGPGIGPEALRRLLKRLDDEEIGGTLELRTVQKAPSEELRKKETLRAEWERHLGEAPSDWSDIYAEVRLDSTDYLERGALLLAPVNPARYAGPATLRFRSARLFGYGVSPGMAARCFERCDEEGITGEVEILYVLSDTHPVGTQGPVWHLGGRTV
ncbi:MAG: hypothetical protein QOF27_1221 [Gaiellaceae bacterium]|jgi:hypothetical protein|nr:hypothetical protein [Gaiellaceae bacterium]